MYQYAFRVLALVFFLAPVWLAPTASYENGATMTGVITRAIEACEIVAATGSMEVRPSAQSESSGQLWAFSTVLDSVLGTLLFGVVVNEPGSRGMMLQWRMAGTAPEVGECRFALPSDCYL